ncbi:MULTISPECIES: hypothetical protein [Micromonospora]|uniref:DUF4177 domain-containing protein n=1 Tax=Micromonospora solifontis TaxID=2487138 RepID=A0ABX9WKP8_9ACTN|nr:MULTISPECIES: hypothetical protein [Micromonospora]NES16351.1 hypothetical protein [Micromonospora sp. PPF5-17B]NES36201.1 hypothetical protein [Micromonospora solifontis]NES57952.1 hypothetical protein [Micromonospora sp. PPF5-6]RNL99791.1 hypothetical protein EFE23_08485 [Micromonospora solifontis]
MTFVPPQQLAQSRTLGADVILRGEVDLRSYPYRHLALVARPAFLASGVTQLLEAVEHLSNYGWELVSVVPVTGSFTPCAFMRRS